MTPHSPSVPPIGALAEVVAGDAEPTGHEDTRLARWREAPSMRRIWRQLGAAAAQLWQRHRLFTIAVAIGCLPRVISMLGFRPALLTQDSFVYLKYGLHLAPNWIRPTGYSVLLFTLQPLHSLDSVTAVQHLAGLAVAVTIYSLLRSRGLPGWGATLAAAPTLFDPRQIWLEQSILPDLWFQVLAVAAVTFLIIKRTPSWWQAALAGFAAGWATITRGNGFVLIAIVFGWLLIRRVGWRRLAAAAVACAVPVLGYMSAFYVSSGDFALSDGDGLFLWARTMSFANCAIIKPPPDLVPLCPRNQPGAQVSAAPSWSWRYLISERQPAAYLWDRQSWLWSGPDPDMDAEGNRRALRFAIMAIKAQPLDYSRVVGSGVLLTFLNTDRALRFQPSPHVPHLPSKWVQTLRDYGGTAANTHAVGAWAFLLFAYQQPVYFSGVLFALVLLGGLGLIVHMRGRGAAVALLTWATAVAIIVVPVAITEYDYRYALPAVPLACLAFALTFRRPGPRPPDRGPGTMGDHEGLADGPGISRS
jgi:hypothetical protein